MLNMALVNEAYDETEVVSFPISHAQWTQEDRNALLRYARRRLRDPDAAEDAVQETLAAALISGLRFQGRSSRLTWAFGILKHKITDCQRADYRERARRSTSTVSGESETDDCRSFAPYAPRWDVGSPAVQCERAEFWTVLRAGVATLPPKTAQVFERSFLTDDNSRDICQSLNISPTNYWVMLHRARKHLQKYLAKHWSTPQTRN